MTSALNKSTYKPTEIIDINKTERRISKLSATIWSLLSVITIVAGIALESLALAILGTIGLSISLILAFSIKRIEPPKFQTVTAGEPFYIAPAPVTPIVPESPKPPEDVPEKSPLASDYYDASLPVVIEQPKDEQKEKEKVEHEEKLAEKKPPENRPSTPTPGEIIDEYDVPAPGMKTPERTPTPTTAPTELPPISIASAKDAPPAKRTLFGAFFTGATTPKQA